MSELPYICGNCGYKWPSEISQCSFCEVERLTTEGARKDAEINALRGGHHEIIRECSQENMDGEPYDTFQDISLNALGYTGGGS